ncbi:hypothetical protein EW026_g3749 [Hermanssonia centrifuga]|uniref:Uncharacterized protein n=1 Tax=Hermanssonia centrifuga TaxID=98765 RepID=A0A4S4KJ87_9APHY|nr:hypothetical protein EW026_g3749 [Hermanssonia centrifuga]
MKFTFVSLIALIAGVQAANATCCIYGPPSSCVSTLGKRLAEPATTSLHLGPGPECCCVANGDGADQCDHCSSA